MFQKKLDLNDGLLMVQEKESQVNAAIHMFFVSMDLGVIWLDKFQKIVDIQLAKSWQPFYRPGLPAQYILEIHPQRLPEFQIGDKISFE